MIIGLDISASGERNTGTSRYISCLLQQLKTTGHDIITFPSEPFREVPGNLKLNSIPVIKRGGIGRHWYRIFQQAGEMKSAHVDFGIFPNYLKPLNFDKASLIIVHDLSFFSHPQFYSKAFVMFYKDQLKRILKSNPLIATVSNYSKESIYKYLCISKERIFLLQPYVDRETFKREKDPLNDITEDPYFLYVGHIEPRKNLSFLIRNFVKWKAETGTNMRLKIAGDLWLNSPEIKNLLNKYKQSPEIEFTGYVEEKELHRLYSNASGFVHTSIVEGFGFPVLEAMHYGLPVLCSSSTSTEEISRPYSVVVDPGSDSELLKGFDRLMLKSLNLGQIPEAEYSPELMQSQLDQILETVKGGEKIYLHHASPSEVETAVEKTLLYYKLFDSGLNADSLHSYLLGLKVTRKQLSEALVTLLDKNVINLTGSTLCLNAEINSFYKRKSKSPDSKLTRRMLRILKGIPFITAIAFSGGTANYGLANHDDIDLFIVTRPFTVYIVYLLIHIISLFMKGRSLLCVNYLVDENAAEINIHRDMYTAHQIIALKAFKNERYMQHFNKKNSWVKKYYPNYDIPERGYDQSPAVYNLFRPLNWLLKKIYSYRYKEIIKSAEEGAVVLTGNIMKLHTRDYRKRVIQEFEIQWSEYLRKKGDIIFPQSIAE